MKRPGVVALLLALAACEGADPVAPNVSDVRWLEVSAAPFHSCAISEDRALYCWGSNDSGQLGRPDDVSGSSRPLRLGGPDEHISVSTGARHTCAIRVDGGVRCWGDNDFGQLGRTPASGHVFGAPVDTPGDFVRVAAGDSHTCALDAAGRTACWGRNNRDQLGRTTTGETDPIPRAVETDRRFVQITTGAEYSCGVSIDGVGYCWGANTTDQLGVGSRSDMPRPTALEPAWIGFRSITAGFDRSCGITLERGVACWGSGPGTPVRWGLGVLAADVAVGGQGWACAAVGPDGVWCSGRSPALDFDTDGPELVVSGTPGFRRIDAGFDHWCGITHDAELFCAGAGGSGQLGHGDTADSPEPVRVGG